MKACGKAAHLWNQEILPTQWQQLPPLNDRGWMATSTALMLPPAVVREAFETSNDERPARRKPFHSEGTSALFKWTPSQSSRYTGIFRTPTCSLISLSYGVNPELLGYIPGLALKFFIDGQPSTNIHLMETFDGKEEPDFFSIASLPMTNWLEAPKSKLIASALQFGKLFAKDPTHIDLDPLASRDARGKSIEQPKAPYQIWLRAMNPLDWNADVDFRVQLADVNPGKLKLEVLGRESPDSAPETLGTLENQTAFVSSEYGDRRLFFKHEAKR
jgi:hypothetical protein